jgi:PadR family transcriptional regulator, regulatory protein AphA
MEVLLGLLAIEPMSGYDLGMNIRASVGHIWNESYGQIYPNLKKMAAAGLVTAKTERQKGKPDRHIYAITAKGRERLAKWLAVPPQPEIARNELLLKLFFGDHVPIDILIGYLERMVENESGVLKQLARVQHEEIVQNQKYPGAAYWKMAARFGELELEAHLRWAKETLSELHKMAGKQRGAIEPRKEKKHAVK